MTITISCSTIRNWNLHVGHTCISREIFDHSVPSTISSLIYSLTQLINLIVCNGIDDKRFAPLSHIKELFIINMVSLIMINSIHYIITGEKVACFDNVHATIRHANCSLLLSGSVCCEDCKLYKKNTLNRLLYCLKNVILKIRKIPVVTSITGL